MPPARPRSGGDPFVAERIAPHKKVWVVEFFDQVPKSASGKILRKDLRARDAAAS